MSRRIGSRDDFYWTLHAVFVKRHEHTILFDQAFKLFFRRRGYLDKLLATMLPETLPTAPKPPAPGAQRVQEALYAGMKAREEEKEEVEVDARLTVSDREVLQNKDFAQMTAAEIAAAKAAIARMALPLDMIKTRRLTAARRGHMIDVRRTLRSSMKAGGAVIDLKYFGPREKEPPIVALLDISGSMSQYTRLFLHFLHAITDAQASASPPSCSARGSPMSAAPSASATRTRRWPRARRTSWTGRAAPASPRPCATSTSTGRAGC